jgi:hypothetical protein
MPPIDKDAPITARSLGVEGKAILTQEREREYEAKAADLIRLAASAEDPDVSKMFEQLALCFSRYVNWMRSHREQGHDERDLLDREQGQDEHDILDRLARARGYVVAGRERIARQEVLLAGRSVREMPHGQSLLSAMKVIHKQFESSLRIIEAEYTAFLKTHRTAERSPQRSSDT